ncbi:response regulator [Paenibacillus sp. R14(2021)]|uniref:response regulator transcription factor n=1 Tax=Paenibacillus sp. R14(2021) TaxID=2859228 RepID=UPI001C615ED8|nr:response regulator [Paenibacillus sp. R14(2021)]
MFKMLIVEDERWEREGLVDFLEWEAMGIGTVETACDGIEGLEKALALQPDIIVTDIQMPGMTGIEMAGRIREQLPQVRIVVLTGYDDFEFARGALRLGAVDYVLKPVEEEEMRSTMLKVVRDCEQERLKQGEEARLRQENGQSRRAALRQLFTELLTSGGAAEFAADSILQLQDLGGFEAGAYSVWIIQPSSLLQTQEIDGLEETAQSVLERSCLVQTVPGYGGGSAFAVLVPLDSEETGSQELLAEELLRALELPPASPHSQQEHAGQPAEAVSGAAPYAEAGAVLLALGAVTDKLEEVGESYRQAQHALRFAVFTGRSGIAQAGEFERAKQQFALVSETFAGRCQELTKQIRIGVAGLDESGTAACLDELFALFAAQPGADRTYVGAVLSGLIGELSPLAAVHGAGSAGEEAERLRELLACERLADMRSCASGLVTEIAARLDAKRNHKDDYVVSRVIRIIEERYGEADLNVTLVAGEVFMSPNHLGMIFKKATGKTLNEYVLAYRLTRAEELLRTTKQRVASVAEQVGIPNTSYFGTLFKQAYGMTPGGYQEVMQRQ